MRKIIVPVFATIVTFSSVYVVAESNNNSNKTKVYEEVLRKYNDDLEKYNTSKLDYDNKLREFNKKQKEYEEAKLKYEADLKKYKDEITAYEKQVAEWDDSVKKDAEKRAEYERKLTSYKKLKEVWDVRKKQYDEARAVYDDAMSKYERAMSEYDKKVKYRLELIKRNKELDEQENERRKIDYEKKKQEVEKESKKPGRFSSDVSNSLLFTHEPDAKVHVDIGPNAALAMISDDSIKGFWGANHLKMTSSKLSDGSLVTNKLQDKVLMEWNPNVKSRGHDGLRWVDSYAVIAKKNQPFKVTYTNIQNSTYDGRKISKIEYIYEAIETGSDSDTMALNIAKDPTTSVWIYGNPGSTTHRTRVKVTPIFYDDQGRKIVPTVEKPILLGMGSMNAGFSTLATDSVWNFYGEDVFEKINGYKYDRGLYLEKKFQEHYGVAWADRNKNGFYDTIKSEWENGLRGKYWSSWDVFLKDYQEKRNSYLAEKYGANRYEWKSQYREIVYNLTNGEFIPLNNSYVAKHEDGYYSDKSVDNYPVAWDNPTSPEQYLGAGIISVTKDNFSMEFGATTPQQQKFALNTSVADYYITTKPKLELQKTPEPPLPDKPVPPSVTPPKEIDNEPPKPPEFIGNNIPKPRYMGPKEPTPPTPFTLVPPVAPSPVNPPIDAVPSDPPIVDIPEFNGGVVPNDPPVHDKPEYNGGVPPIDPPVLEIPEFKGGVVPLDPPIVEKPEIPIPKEPKPEPKPEPKLLPKTGSELGNELMYGLGVVTIGGIVLRKRKSNK